MKKIFLVLIVCLAAHQARCQEEQLVKSQVDSILQKISAETDVDKRVTLMLSILVTKIEGYPHLALYTYEKLSQLAQQKKG